MDILNNFGFEWTLFFAQIVNFLIIFWLLKKFLYKPVLKLLEERRTKIEDGLKNADKAAKLLEDTVQKEGEVLRKAQTEAKKLLDEARAERDSTLRQAEEDTKKKIEIMLNDARKQINFEADLTSKKLESNVTKLAIELLQKSLTGLFGEKEQEIIMKNALKKIK